MNILIGCEESQTVTAAFRALGHNAYSCDLKPAKINPDWHFQGDIFDVIDMGWDLAIFHPPCTYLSFAGNGWFDIEKYGDNAVERYANRREAMDFFMRLALCDIPSIAIENPRGYPCSNYRKPDQIIHPWYFGDEDKKATCLWLKNLPRLTYCLQDNLFEAKTATKEPAPIYIDKSGEKRYFTDSFSPGPLRQEYRSKTFPGIANAMADQWTKYLTL